MTHLRISLALAVLGVALAAPAARAGTYDVSACDAAPGFVNNSWSGEVNHGGMLTYTACPAGDDPRYGLGARHNTPYPSGYTVPTGSAARWIFRAPPATAIVGIRADALFEQSSHRWQSGLSNGSTLLFGCPWTPSSTGGICVSAMYAAEWHPLPPSGVIYTEAFCAYGPCPVGGSTMWVRASLTFAQVTISDGTIPHLANPRGDLWTGDWISGTRTVVFDAGDNTGIKEVRALVDGRVMASDGRGCDPTRTTCPDWPGAALTVATTNGLGDGVHQLALEAVDRGDNRHSLTREIRVDNTAPAAPAEVTLAGGDGWRSTNDFDLRWKNPPQDAAPVAAVEYRLCASGGGSAECTAGTRTAVGIESLEDLQVPRPGDWTLTLWLRDEAGNARPETAAPPLHLRYDPDPPAIAIPVSDPENPARVRVTATDSLSGISRGEIEVRRVDGTAWRPLAAQPEADGFSAVVDEENLRDGVYDLRARVWDGAGNERSTDRRANGEVARLMLPLRVKTKLKVGTTKRVRARRSRGGRRRRIVYVRNPSLRQGRRIRLRGRLTAPGGNPLQDVDVEVSARLAIDGAAFQPVATLKTSRTGRFTYLLPAGPARIVRFRYAGGPKIRPRTRDVHVRVRAHTSMRQDRRRVVNGEAVTFSGRLRGGFLPAGGKLVELQFFDRGKWRTFRTFRAAASSGGWSYSYRFDGTRGTRRYRFRARVPRENGYPYSTGASRSVAVTVRGL